jgi:hypothetical protein
MWLIRRLPSLRWDFVFSAGQECCQSRDDSAGDDDAFPDEAGGKYERSRSAEGREQRDQCGFSDADAALCQRQERGEFCEGPREEPNA